MGKGPCAWRGEKEKDTRNGSALKARGKDREKKEINLLPIETIRRKSGGDDESD